MRDSPEYPDKMIARLVTDALSPYEEHDDLWGIHAAAA